MALLRLHSCTLNPFRVSVVARVSCASYPVRVLRPSGPLHWTPTLALSISISFPSQYVSRWRPMQDRCFNIGSALTYNNYRSVESAFHSTVLRSLSSRLPFQSWCFRVFRRPPRRCLGRERKSSSPHRWKWLSRWSEIDPLCSIQHRSDAARGQAGATPRGCARVEAE